MPKPPVPDPWVCPQCHRTYPLPEITPAERALLDIVAHLIGAHTGYPPA